MRIRIVWVVFVLLLFGCERDSSLADVGRLGLDYFPLQQGNFAVYNVQEVEYTILGQEVNSEYQLMIEISTVFQNDDEDIYTINRYTRATTTEDWELSNVWSAQKDNYRAVIVEENIAYQKLSFPVGNDISWDGNALNTSEYEDYYFQKAGEAFTTDDETLYDNTVTVVHNDLLDKIVTTDYRIEVYAKDIGLLFKESNIINYCTDPDCLGQEIIETGKIYRQSLIEYGEN